ncbi:DUF1176 domain-containing protein [Coralloluteibacterium thermophilus]|uniref:DUF1176 domain-containing protein n=1 Tax=Coralloluteibacterium thermophilum TaxID=2707049 RepID=A0ABV9NI68_9GAMM
MIRPQSVPILALALLLAGGTWHGGARAAPAVPVYQVFQDTLVVCDNGRDCEVVAVNREGNGMPLRLRREAGPAGMQHLELAAQGPVDAEALRLDGRMVPALDALPWRVQRADGLLALDEPAAIARFIDIVRNGRHLTVGKGEDVPTASLAGFSAALLRVDEVQQRLGTEGAWLRRGDRADADVPPPPALPVLPLAAPEPVGLAKDVAARLAQHVRAAQAEALHAEECEEAGGPFDVSRHDGAAPLDDTHALVFLTCFAGAYQHASLVFRVPRDGSGPAERITLPGGGIRVAERGSEDFALLTSPEYAPATATLIHFAKGRGLGDCGQAVAWHYDGREFHLAVYAELTLCGGTVPGAWPQLWRTVDPSPGGP